MFERGYRFFLMCFAFTLASMSAIYLRLCLDQFTPPIIAIVITLFWNVMFLRSFRDWFLCVREHESSVGWFGGMPDKPGDYLWITAFGCTDGRGKLCCIASAGMAYIYDAPEIGDSSDFQYQTKAGRKLCVQWFNEPPFRTESGYAVDGWRPIVFPYPKQIGLAPE